MKLTIKVANFYIRMMFDGDEADIKQITDLLNEKFNGKANNVTVAFQNANNNSISYHAPSWGRVWSSNDPSFACIEWFFPKKKLLDEDVTNLVEQTLKHFSLTSAVDEQIQAFSLSALKNEEDVTAVDGLDIQRLEQAVEACNNFITHTNNYLNNAKSDPDKVVLSTAQPPARKNLGNGFFSGPTLALAAASPATNAPRAAAQSSSASSPSPPGYSAPRSAPPPYSGGASSSPAGAASSGPRHR